jgi:hypothetical protein
VHQERLILRGPEYVRLVKTLTNGLDCKGEQQLDAAKHDAVRFLDRFSDNYIMTPMVKVASDQMRADGERDATAVADAKALLDIAYGWLEKRIAH